MRVIDNIVRVMPDIAAEARPHVGGRLEWVGMDRIEAPVRLHGVDGTDLRVPASITAYVDLDQADVRGIHMSRLYLNVDRHLGQEVLTPASIRNLLREFLSSHAGLSTRAMLRIDFNYLLRRPALVSDNTGWKQYPVTIAGMLDENGLQLELGCEVLYSSTCPCSAALARQLIQEAFDARFGASESVSPETVRAWLGSEQGVPATPHSQRSAAELRIRLGAAYANFPIVELIDLAEKAVSTPVQAAVKREDEQAFARLNGQNLMFCEDAARRVQRALNEDERIEDFWVRCSHFESLHPHDAVAIATKGVVGGFGSGLEAMAHIRR